MEAPLEQTGPWVLQGQLQAGHFASGAEPYTPQKKTTAHIKTIRKIRQSDRNQIPMLKERKSQVCGWEVDEDLNCSYRKLYFKQLVRSAATERLSTLNLVMTKTALKEK